MLNSFFMAAALLLNGTFVSTAQNSVESSNYASVAEWQFGQKMSREVEAILIEQYAAPHWNLSISEAWYYYQTLKLIKITEIVPDVQYLIEYDGILDVVLEDSNM